MKMLIGFIMGIMVASALAQGIVVTAMTPDGQGSIIRVDRNGYVICSTEAR